MTRFFFAIPLVLIASALRPSTTRGMTPARATSRGSARALMQSGDNAVLGCLQTNRARDQQAARKCWPITPVTTAAAAAVATTGNTSSRRGRGCRPASAPIRTTLQHAAHPNGSGPRWTRSPFDGSSRSDLVARCAGRQKVEPGRAMDSARHNSGSAMSRDRPAIGAVALALSCTSCITL